MEKKKHEELTPAESHPYYSICNDFFSLSIENLSIGQINHGSSTFDSSAKWLVHSSLLTFIPEDPTVLGTGGDSGFQGS